MCFKALDDFVDTKLDATTQIHWVHSSSDRFAALFEDGTGEDRGCRCAVTSLIIGLASDLLYEVGADVLVAIAELDVLGHSDTILGDLGHAKSPVEDDVAATWAQSHLHSVSKLIAALKHERARISSEFDVLTGEVHTLGSDELGGGRAVEEFASGLHESLLESRLHHCFLFVFDLKREGEIKLIQANKSMKSVILKGCHDNKISQPYISVVESRNKIISSEILFYQKV